MENGEEEGDKGTTVKKIEWLIIILFIFLILHSNSWTHTKTTILNLIKAVNLKMCTYFLFLVHLDT